VAPISRPLRTGLDDNQLRALITGVWNNREDRYSELRAQQPGTAKVEMYYIGG
jgi:cyclic pyranopterin phosphate synthase